MILLNTEFNLKQTTRATQYRVLLLNDDLCAMIEDCVVVSEGYEEYGNSNFNRFLISQVHFLFFSLNNFS